jgi:hypothetical protein
MQMQTTSNLAAAGSSVLAEAGRSETREGAPVLDYVFIAGLLFITTYAFVYGSAKMRLMALVLSLLLGILKPYLLIFALSLAASLEINQSYFMTPMRIVILFAGISIVIRFRSIINSITKHDIACLAYYMTFALWCVLCTLLRLDAQGISNILTTFTYAIICFFLFIMIRSKYSISNYIWFGLIPTVISSIMAALNLRVVQEYEYLITDEGLRYRGIVNDPNYLSSILLVGFTTCTVCLITKRGVLNKAIYLVASAAFFFAIWVPQSRGGIYTACFCLVLLIVLQMGLDFGRVRIGNIILMASICVLAAIFLMKSSHSRVFFALGEGGGTLIRSITKEAVTPILKDPVFGPGEVNFVKRYGAAPHNTLMSIGLEYGIIGMVLMFAGILYSFINLWRYRKNGSMIFFFPLLSLNMILCSFSGPGHKLLWFYLIAGALFDRRTLSNGSKNLATCC